MKVDGTGTIRPGQQTAKKRKAGDSDAFARELAENDTTAPAAQPTGSLSGPASIGALLSLQAVDATDATDPEASRRAAIDHGTDILDRLEALRRDLLMGQVPVSRLQQIADLIDRQREQTVDPKLNAILDEIELRAQVELAKWARDNT